VHLTKRVVDALEPGDEHFIVWDDEVSGLGVRVTKTGVKAFVVDYTTRVGRRRRLTIGRYGSSPPIRLVLKPRRSWDLSLSAPTPWRRSYSLAPRTPSRSSSRSTWST
jgi:hypothetical protein